MHDVVSQKAHSRPQSSSGTAYPVSIGLVRASLTIPPRPPEVGGHTDSFLQGAS